MVYETDAGVEAYAVYKTKMDWNTRGPSGTVHVSEAIASAPRGQREIWRFLFDVDLMRKLEAWRLPVDHPVLLLTAEPRRLGVTLGDGLWLRIVDVQAALEGRTYGADGLADGRLTLELVDEYCPWNAGRWSLEIAGGRATLKRSAVEADLALDANDLAAMFMGGVSAAALAGAGRVEERKPGSLAAADRLFLTALAPWCPQEF